MNECLTVIPKTLPNDIPPQIKADLEKNRWTANKINRLLQNGQIAISDLTEKDFEIFKTVDVLVFNQGKK